MDLDVHLCEECFKDALKDSELCADCLADKAGQFFLIEEQNYKLEMIVWD
jgi:hypothetical protein